MKNPSVRWIALLSLVAGIGAASTASATSTWTFTDTTAANTSKATVASTTAATATLSGISGVYAPSALGSNTWTAGTVTWYSGGGLAMTSGTDSGSPYHALDNNGNTEAILLNFSSSVSLTSIGLGYAVNDTTEASKPVDLSLFRWTGSGAPTGSPPLVSQGAAAMAGWQLVGNYGDMVVDKSEPYNLVNSTGLGSSWWLISAYNSGFTSAAKETRGSLDDGSDFFKVYAVAGTNCSNTTTNGCGGGGSKVPEPASLALVAVGLLGVVGARRRNAAKAR